MSWFLVLLAFLLASIKTTNNKKKNTSVDVVIPAYNEENTVAEVVKIVKSIKKVNEIVVVNDGSTDNTEEEALRAGARVINHNKNKGKGAALKTGFKNTKSDIVVFIDADISNLTVKKVNAIIDPLIKNEFDITKTKFSRESGRVTELTAKPLLKFFFPEITYEQPLSGQFAGKRSALNKIKFEDDYGVDVGIVIDADINGINIGEIDIGDIKHDMSSLSDLNIMANEVVRTIIDRAVNYGRVTMMDTLGEYIRLSIMGLSLIILGLFILFFIPSINFFVSLAITGIGLILTIYYLFKTLKSSIPVFRKGSKLTVLKSFCKMHFPLLVCAVILILMLTTFMSAAVLTDNGVSIEPRSRNLIIFSPSDNAQPISVRGPYTIDSAIENETNIIRFPSDALTTMDISKGDILKIGDGYYTVNETRSGEFNTFRIPSDARNILNAKTGSVISDSSLNDLFDSVTVTHFSNISNTSNLSSLSNFTIADTYIIHPYELNQTNINITINGTYIKTLTGYFTEDGVYSISIGGNTVKTFKGSEFANDGVLEFYNGDTLYVLNFTKPANSTTSHNFVTTSTDSFLKF